MAERVREEPRLLITMREAIARGLSRRHLAEAQLAGRVHRRWHGSGREYYDAEEVDLEIARRAGVNNSYFRVAA